MPATKANYFIFVLLIPLLSTLVPTQTWADANDITLVDAHASMHGETAQAGFFTYSQTIDLVFVFDLDSSSSESLTFTWEVYNRYDRLAHSGSYSRLCEPGENTVSIPDAIPTDLGTGTQTYHVYAAVTADGLKGDNEFDIRIENPDATPGLFIEDVRLSPRQDDSGIAEEMSGVAIPYTLEIDFRTENIISWAHARIRWLGLTADGFELDRGLGSTDVEEGFNSFTVDSYIARPPYGSMPQADFSVEVEVFGYIDSATFPLSSLPTSLMEIRSREGVDEPTDFSVGEAYLFGEDGARTNIFQANEQITARILTGGTVPENTQLLMKLAMNEVVAGGVPDDEEVPSEQFVVNLESGTTQPAIDYQLPIVVSRDPGYYDFTWTFVVNGIIYAERHTSVTISGREGIVIPTEIEIPGGITLTVPLTWTVSDENEGGLIATLITPDNVICRLLVQEMTETPLNVGRLADLFEGDFAHSGIPSDAVQLTTDDDSLEGIWEFEQRAWLGDGKSFVNDYWLINIPEGDYIFLIAASTGTENNVGSVYDASEKIRASLDLGF